MLTIEDTEIKIRPLEQIFCGNYDLGRVYFKGERTPRNNKIHNRWKIIRVDDTLPFNINYLLEMYVFRFHVSNAAEDGTAGL